MTKRIMTSHSLPKCEGVFLSGNVLIQKWFHDTQKNDFPSHGIHHKETQYIDKKCTSHIYHTYESTNLIGVR